MKEILKLLKFDNENGASLVIVALAMVALLGFTALAIDGGRLYIEKSKLQNALDATVLAGAQGLRTSQTRAIEISEDVSEKNGYKVSASDLSFPDNSIKATKQINVPMTFAKVIGINTATVSASAKATVGPLTKASGISPFVIMKSDIPNRTILNCGSTNPGDLSGNCGYLKTSESNLRDAILKGSTFDSSKTVWTDPGAAVGQVGQAIDELIARDKLKDAAGNFIKPHCQSASTADNSCERVLTFVVIDEWKDVKGNPVTGTSELKIAGFASFYIEKYDDKKLYGEFIKMVEQGEIGTGTGIGEYNLVGVKLDE
ncbi:TadE/TadG family type IV pilus assembly protein [Bacillus sp. FJAT-29814]|uniref:TadE/TadG family type IV pilus assembly protein n=1 Tax=Bacillus sp. FJAT-29814 TaxID=1729688 RepID=UPI00082E53F6|nr:TadE/TadG family type IV pilus assembly protein [Bacillus sp. FJAT-29814]